MRRIIIVLTVLLLAAMFVSPVQSKAETYEVKKGDNLWKISQRFHVSVESLWEANKDKVPDKDLIYPGQKLEIPQEVFHYRHPNADPFSRARDPIRLIDKFDCPQEVKQFMKKLRDFSDSSEYEVKKGDTLWKLEDKFGISAEKIYKTNKEVINHPEKWLFPGQKLQIPEFDLDSGRTVFLSSQEDHLDHLNQMGFGEYKVRNNVQVEFQEPQKAKRWRIILGDYNYFLVVPLNCYNWGWYKQPREQPEKPLPPEEEEKEKEPPKKTSAPEKKDEQREGGPGWDAWAYAGHYKGVQEGNNENWHQYIGANISLFPDSFLVNGGRFRVGPAAQYLAWQGEADNAVDYSGDLRLLGAEMEYLGSGHNTSLTVYGGEKRGRVEGKGFPYRSRESADMLVLEGSHEWWYSRPWFPQMEAGTRLQFAFNEEKQSYWDGQPISEEPLQQGEYSARYKTDIYGHPVATPTLELSAGWREFDQSSFAEPRAGIEWFRDTFATEASYLWVEHSQNDMAAAHVRTNLSKLVSKLINASQGGDTEDSNEKTDTSESSDTSELRLKADSQEMEEWLNST